MNSVSEFATPETSIPEISRIEVWADVGGTFTDCFVNQDGVRAAAKVLSTGVVRCRVSQWIDAQTAAVDFDASHRVDGFWDGCSVRRVESASGETVCGEISRYESLTNTLHFTSSVTLPLPDHLEIAPCLEAPVLAARLLLGVPPKVALPPLHVRLGTTRGTNALLTRSGATTCLLVTAGFADVLRIGEQDRPELFTLDIEKRRPLTEHVIEVRGRLDNRGQEIEPLDLESLRTQLLRLQQAGIESLAICLLNSYINAEHEQLVERLAREIGFVEISRSSEVSPLIKLVARAETTVLDAYLNPVLRRYVERVWQQFGGQKSCRLRLMTSCGHLVAPDVFRGRDCILSGPAGGIVALADIAKSHLTSDHPGMIGLDMGGTSTDVSRLEGTLPRRYESRVAGVRVLTPMIDIQTVAAGGGSVCQVRSGRLCVGPESAGADPGPACYGRGGPLTVTDVNLLLGRIDRNRFPFELDLGAADAALHAVACDWELATHTTIEPTRLAEGFLQIAVTHMAEAVRTVSTAQGSDVRALALVGFGGAAGQHLCRIANSLGMRRILDPMDASMLSALGMGLASVGKIVMRGVYRPIDDQLCAAALSWSEELREQAHTALLQESDHEVAVTFRDEVDMRYVGTDASLPLLLHPIETLVARFHQSHESMFGYRREQRAVELVALRCDAEVRRRVPQSQVQRGFRASVIRRCKLWNDNDWVDASVIDRASLQVGDTVEAPSLIVSDLSVLVVEPGWSATVLDDGTLELVRCASMVSASSSTNASADDPVLLEIIARRLQGIADTCGETLRLTSTSVNVKERRDFSCAIFRSDGSLIANAPHVPVHLGAMGHTVRYLMQRFPQMTAGDCYISNDPFAGGSHLPDVTVVAPVFCTSSVQRPDFFVASRAHHAEIGGLTPGSMPPNATCLAEEGVLIRAFALVRGGVMFYDELGELLSSGPYPSRNVSENLADISAQQAAAAHGARLLQQLAVTYSVNVLDAITAKLLDAATDNVRQWIRTLPSDKMHFSDSLDDGTQIELMMMRQGDRLAIDFSGTAAVHRNGFNATPAIVTAAVLYVLRCLSGSQLPLNDGVMRQIDLRIPTGLLNPPAHEDPRKCAAVVAGNVETSQRIVDCLLGALGVAAASQGTMNNVLMGDEKFGYYETIGGGSGAGPWGDGASAVHTHMTNTRITDPEVLEARLPVRLLQFSIRTGSGGGGKYRGGDGLVRRFKFLRPLVVSMLTNRRMVGPYGAQGGENGQPGLNFLFRNGARTVLPATTQLNCIAGDELEIHTPGGGGWGTS